MKLIFYSAFLVIVLSFISCSKKSKEANAIVHAATETTLTLDESQMRYVKIDTVKEVKAAAQITAVGEVSFAEDNVVRVYPIVSGTVEEVNVSLGDYVKKGQLLSSLLSTNISEYQRDYNIAKSNIEVQEKNMIRSQDLYKAGMLSEKELAEARNTYNNAKSEFNEKKQILALYGGSPDDLDATFRVTAPRSGYIVERNINSGTQIRNDNATNIFTISDLKTVWVWANVHESDLAKVHEGDMVQVRTIAYPDKVFNGTIKKIGTMLDPASRVIRVRTELNNDSGLLKPEMFATVVITPKIANRILAVPQTAIVLESNQYYVMKEVAPRQFEKIHVQVGKTFPEFTEIISGITKGDKIVADGALFVLTAFNQM
jgi:membrane fusion protein, heavy metal efflux system